MFSINKVCFYFLPQGSLPKPVEKQIQCDVEADLRRFL